MKCSTHWLYGNQTTPHNVAIATPRDTVWLPHNLCVDHYVYYELKMATETLLYICVCVCVANNR